jgi:hypothetical protein
VFSRNQLINKNFPTGERHAAIREGGRRKGGSSGNRKRICGRE